MVFFTVMIIVTNCPSGKLSLPVICGNGMALISVTGTTLM